MATSLERSPKEAIVLQWLRPWGERDDQQLVKSKSLEHADPLKESVCLTPADSRDLVNSISFALQFEGRKRFHRGDEFMANLAADHIVRYLKKTGYVVMKKPPAVGAGGNSGRRGFGG